MTGCALCGKSSVRHRLDLTYGDLHSEMIGDYTITAVFRGLALCDECRLNARLVDVLNLAGGEVGIVRGCLVQCTGQPPWWLRHVLPGGPRTWSKVSCPACAGRATVQLVVDAVDRRPGLFTHWGRAFGEAFGLLKWWGSGEEWDDDRVSDSGGSGPVPGPEGDVPYRDVSVEDGDERQGGEAGEGTPVVTVQGQQASIIIGGEA